MIGTRGSIGVQTLDGARFHHRIGTTDELVLDAQYGSPRFLAAGYQARETDTILDVGAHIGVFAVLAARHVPKGVVHALEPGAENFVLLQRNLRENGVKNAVAHKLALSRSTGTIRLYHGPGSVGHSLYPNPEWEGVPIELRDKGAEPEEPHEDIYAQVFEEFLAEQKINRVDYMKMNIEGAEYDVFDQAPDSVLRSISAMQVELHPAEDGVVTGLLERVTAAGFRISVTWSNEPTVKGWLSARRA